MGLSETDKALIRQQVKEIVKAIDRLTKVIQNGERKRKGGLRSIKNNGKRN